MPEPDIYPPRPVPEPVRLRVFSEETEPLVKYYRDRPTFASIHGLQPPDKVTADLRAHIEAVMELARTARRARA